MKKFETYSLNIEFNSICKRTPDFNNLLKVLKRGKPSRPTLFEFFLNDNLYCKLTKNIVYDAHDELQNEKRLIDAFHNAGYDYVTLPGSDFWFHTNRHNEGKATASLNDGSVINDKESFEKYDWPDPDSCDYSRLKKLAGYLPEGMKIIISGPGGVLENVISLVGFDNLCYMIADEPDLVSDIFNQVGSRLVRYYEHCSGFNSVGAMISNDDWGFNTQTMLSTADMRKYVIPWHKKIVEVIHASGKPAILHSCGNLSCVMEDIIDDVKYDAKHSYEDKILPVEEAYAKYGDRIAILGGIDLDFLCRSTPEQIYERSVNILQKAADRGGYALGSGNSIPPYVPEENYLAMISAINEVF